MASAAVAQPLAARASVGAPGGAAARHHHSAPPLTADAATRTAAPGVCHPVATTGPIS